ncbi:hypothetical protein IMY05_006G0166600 [Salix suchowensis]|nr:hypothetical protein IMY05_006G0166600 [Salix suchowensis]
MQNAFSAMKFRNQFLSVSPKHQNSTTAWASGVKSNLHYLDTCHMRINAF